MWRAYAFRPAGYGFSGKGRVGGWRASGFIYLGIFATCDSNMFVETVLETSRDAVLDLAPMLDGPASCSCNFGWNHPQADGSAKTVYDNLTS